MWAPWWLCTNKRLSRADARLNGFAAEGAKSDALVGIEQ